MARDVADAETPSSEQLGTLRGMVVGYRVSQALHCVATLGIADLLKLGPRDADDLARTAGAHADTLCRVMRFLSGVGIFREVEPRRFALTPLGAGLRTDIPNTVDVWAKLLPGEAIWDAWGDLLHSVRTGETTFDHAHGRDFFGYMTEHPTFAAMFNAAMTSDVARLGAAITEGYDFSPITRLVDVGGGHGLQLATILRANPTMRGVLFDRPSAVEGARPILEAAGVLDRCEIVGGDFFQAVPQGGDAYIMRQIIHDWDDARSVTILRHCREALATPAGRVLIVEKRVPDDNRRALRTLNMDMEMLVLTGGRERTEAEYGALFAAAGCRLARVVPLVSTTDYCVFEGTPTA